MKQISFKSTLVALLLIVSIIANAQDKKLPNIVILATGGTIAGAGASSTGSAWRWRAVILSAVYKWSFCLFHITVSPVLNA
jgi:L-asparaginase/Glu-tRNA(Gln) amidotransferase subunit D